MITLAFYKGQGKTLWHRLQDAAIRLATGGRFSHVELIEGAANLGEEHLCWSSSGRDGGVRSKVIRLDPDSWELVALNVLPAGPVSFIAEKKGAAYDFRGILLSHVFAFGLHSRQMWFCSEIIAASIGIPSPQRVSPQGLYDSLTWWDAKRLGSAT